MEPRVGPPSAQRGRADRRFQRAHECDVARGPGFDQGIGLRTAVAINMTQMCGIGPFVTIPLMIAALGGPQAVFGWIVGALLALVDGLVWAELGAAMPGAGGTYLYPAPAWRSPIPTMPLRSAARSGPGSAAGC